MGCIFESLPLEIRLIIVNGMEYLEDIVRLSTVNHQWHLVCSSSLLNQHRFICRINTILDPDRRVDPLLFSIIKVFTTSHSIKNYISPDKYKEMIRATCMNVYSNNYRLYLDRNMSTIEWYIYIHKLCILPIRYSTNIPETYKDCIVYLYNRYDPEELLEEYVVPISKYLGKISFEKLHMLIWNMMRHYFDYDWYVQDDTASRFVGKIIKEWTKKVTSISTDECYMLVHHNYSDDCDIWETEYKMVNFLYKEEMLSDKVRNEVMIKICIRYNIIYELDTQEDFQIPYSISTYDIWNP